MKASDLFVRCLEAEGIEYIFGVPGEENADFMMSLEGSSIRFVLTRHEQGAAFMAEIYGRLTGNPAACLGTLGPGATNLITGVADANMDRAPMLVLTGQGDTQRLHKESHQVMDVVRMFEPVTKWAETVRHPHTIPELVRKAVRVARTEKPGAVHLELPEDLAKLDTDAKPIPPRRFRRPVPDEKIINRALDLIRDARRPVILAGNGHVRHKYGIPERLHRRNHESFKVVVQDEEIEDGIADYVLLTTELQGEKSPKLGIMVEEKDQGLEVMGISHIGPAKKAGLQKGDVIKAFGGQAIKSLADLKLELFYSKIGSNVKIQINREGKLLDKEMEMVHFEKFSHLPGTTDR